MLVSLLTSTSIQAQKDNFPNNGFIENKGQILDQNGLENSKVLFLYAGRGMNIQLRKTGYSYEFFSTNGPSSENSGNEIGGNPSELLNATIDLRRIDIDFLGMTEAVKIEASGPSDDYLNYFISQRNISNVHIFQKVSYLNVFPNTDIDFFITGDENAPLKYNIILRPGADINRIKFLVNGRGQFLSLENGALKYSTTVGGMNEDIPTSYYLNDEMINLDFGKKHSVSAGEFQQVNFKLENNVISFVALYDNKKTLVIDPSTNRIWGTYFGGTFGDLCNAVRCDAQNNVYITGHTLNSTNIATIGITNPRVREVMTPTL